MRVRLEGPTAVLGEVAASDFARLLLGTQSAIQRAAGHVIGRAARETGRPGKTIEDSTRLRLVAIERGSIVAVLAAPPRSADPHRFDLTDPALGELAIDTALQIAAGEDTTHPDVADAFVRMADEIGIGRRYDAVTFEHRHRDRDYTVRLDVEARERLSVVARRAPTARDDSVVGTLVEADFENLTARLRGPGGSKTTVSFPADLADEIQEGLRAPARLRGEVRYDPSTSEARSIELHQIVRGDQLAIGLDPGEFWSAKTVEQLAEEAGVKPVYDVEALRDDAASKDEIDRILAALEDM